MAAPSMVTRDGDNLVVRSVVSGDALFGTELPEKEEDQTPEEPATPEEFLPQTRVKRNYSCSTCDFTTQNPRSFLHHLKDDHKQKFKIYECPRCLYASRHSQKLHRHMHMVHVLGAVKRKPSVSSSVRLRRIKPRPAVRPQEPPPKPPPLPVDTEFTLSDDGTSIVYKCSVCDFSTKSQTTLVRHERVIHLKKKFFRCSKCDYATHIRARYTKHVKYHSMPMIKCDICDFRTPYKWNLERHNKNHQGDGAFKCYMCNFTADIKQSLTVHELNHHSANQVVTSRRRYKVGASDMLPPHDDQLDIVNFESREANHLSKAERIAARKLQLKEMREKARMQQMMQENQGFDLMGTQVEIPVEGQIRVKCRTCLFSHESLDEVRKHEATFHGPRMPPINPVMEKKKAPRPIPNLIPIANPPPGQPQKQPTPPPSSNLLAAQLQQMPQPSILHQQLQQPPPQLTVKDMNDLCAKTSQSSLKDFASLLGGVPSMNFTDDMKPAQHRQTSLLRLTPETRSSSPDSVDSKKDYGGRKKASSFFNKLQERLMSGTGEADLLCSVCGYQAKCLSELVKHKESLHPEEEAIESATCQQCGLVCSSPNELQSHSLTCNPGPLNIDLGHGSPAHMNSEVSRSPRHSPQRLMCDLGPSSRIHSDLGRSSPGRVHSLTNEVTIKLQEVKKEPVDEDMMTLHQPPKHPMENKVFVWNTFHVGGPPMMEQPEQNEEIPLTAADKLEDTNIYLGTEIKPGYGTAVVMTPEERSIASKSAINVRKAYKCPHCDFWASTASRFHVHIVGHLNKRPFRCSLCQYSSNWRWDITKHIRLKGFRDPDHQGAKVLLTDEAGMRDYAKYLALIKVDNQAPGSVDQLRRILPRPINSQSPPKRSASPQNLGDQPPNKKNRLFNTKKMWKCKKCQYRNSDRAVVLAHVRSHYQPDSEKTDGEIKPKEEPAETPPHSDNEKHENSIDGTSGLINMDNSVDGDSRRPSLSDSENKECPNFMCETCPFYSDTMKMLEEHSEKHFVTHGAHHKCKSCPYYASDELDLDEHSKLHDIQNECDQSSHSFFCRLCPYVGQIETQYVYHKKWHDNNSENATYRCQKCSYSAPSSTILVLHARLHRNAMGDSPEKKIPPRPSPNVPLSSYADISGVDTTKFTEIPLAWVCKGSRISKMFKCRFCPHVNIRKPNIQEHEKMHSDRSPNKMGPVTQHRCTQCNYVCNNAGVLSSHTKVHQAFYGTVCAIADPSRPDEDQIEEVKQKMIQDELSDLKGDAVVGQTAAEVKPGIERLIHFCSICPARFLYPKELMIHSRFHVLKLPFRCETCSYTARQRQHLFIHKKVHTNDYHERTKILLMSYSESSENPRPPLMKKDDESGTLWVISKEGIVDENVSLHCPKCPAKFPDKDSFDRHFAFHGWPGKFKCKYCDFTVLLFDSLIQHELLHTEAEDDNASLTSLSLSDAKSKKKEDYERVPKDDPEFGNQIHGRPDFIYPTTMRNGKPKQKKYKCHKCPTAFEKRDQYKIHLALHGAKQKYNCDRCDYSVKYYANYIQHMRKHNAGDSGKGNKSPIDDSLTDDLISEDTCDGSIRTDSQPFEDQQKKSIGMCLADEQTLEFIKQREAESKFSTDPVHRCPFCPYTNPRRDAVMSHLKCHSATARGKCYSCNYCDYKVPQGRFFREHIKSHFAPMKYIKPDCYMKIDQLEIWAEPVDQNDNTGKFLVFKDKGEEFDITDRFLPEFDFVKPAPPSPRGRVYINLKTGEEEVELDEEEKPVNGVSKLEDEPMEEDELPNENAESVAEEKDTPLEAEAAECKEDKDYETQELDNPANVETVTEKAADSTIQNVNVPNTGPCSSDTDDTSSSTTSSTSSSTSSSSCSSFNNPT